MKIAFFSGGKDSVYAALLEWPVDMFFISVYSFPRPSPHLVNLHKTVKLAVKLGVPTLVVNLPKGAERRTKADLLRRLGARVLVAGDQAVEEHLRYMEQLARETGAELREPLWGRDPTQILYEEAEKMEFIVIGGLDRSIVCRRVGRENVADFLADLKKLGIDPIGERGEYHTLVTRVGAVALDVQCGAVEKHGDYYIARLV